jgi:hypothetical protein
MPKIKIVTPSKKDKVREKLRNMFRIDLTLELFEPTKIVPSETELDLFMDRFRENIDSFCEKMEREDDCYINTSPYFYEFYEDVNLKDQQIKSILLNILRKDYKDNVLKSIRYMREFIEKKEKNNINKKNNIILIENQIQSILHYLKDDLEQLFLNSTEGKLETYECLLWIFDESDMYDSVREVKHYCKNHENKNDRNTYILSILIDLSSEKESFDYFFEKYIIPIINPKLVKKNKILIEDININLLSEIKNKMKEIPFFKTKIEKYEKELDFIIVCMSKDILEYTNDPNFSWSDQDDSFYINYFNEKNNLYKKINQE